MSGTRPVTLTEPVAGDVASILRHDLVTPINLIVGYCDLLISEAVESSRATSVAPLRSIRALGFTLLRLIDQALLSDQPERSLSDIQELASSLEEPVGSLVERCDALESSAQPGEDGDNFIDDLLKIRSAGVRLLVMAQTLAAGRFPATDEPGVGSESNDR